MRGDRADVGRRLVARALSAFRSIHPGVDLHTISDRDSDQDGAGSRGTPLAGIVDARKVFIINFKFDSSV